MKTIAAKTIAEVIGGGGGIVLFPFRSYHALQGSAFVDILLSAIRSMSMGTFLGYQGQDQRNGGHELHEIPGLISVLLVGSQFVAAAAAKSLFNPPTLYLFHPS